MKNYHILSLSGGKDSTALAFWIKEHKPEIFKEMDMLFCDTECELPETYEYLNKIEVFLGKEIIRIKPYKNFEHLMDTYGYLPSPIRRWCTVEMKTKPFRKWLYDNVFSKEDVDVYMYIGIRADEPRRIVYNRYAGDTIKEVYPFVDNNIYHQDVMNILEKTGVGLPAYYDWSPRSGCYFCPFQSKNTWLNLFEHHPDLFYKAKAFEDKRNEKTEFKKVGWNLDMLLEDMIKPENMKKIREDEEKRIQKKKEKSSKKQPRKLIHIYSDDEVFEEDEELNGCLLCHL